MLAVMFAKWLLILEYNILSIVTLIISHKCNNNKKFYNQIKWLVTFEFTTVLRFHCVDKLNEWYHGGIS